MTTTCRPVVMLRPWRPRWKTHENFWNVLKRGPSLFCWVDRFCFYKTHFGWLGSQLILLHCLFILELVVSSAVWKEGIILRGVPDIVTTSFIYTREGKYLEFIPHSANMRAFWLCWKKQINDQFLKKVAKTSC